MTKRWICAVTAFICAAASYAADVSLADALKVIQSKEYVDLTHSFSPTTPVWQGFGQATMSAACDPKTHAPYTIEKDGFRTTFYSMVGQYGTHCDPPAHFSNDGMTMDQIPLKQMILPLVVFDVTPLLGKDPNHALTVDDIAAWEKVHGRVPAGAFAALRTDMYKDWDSDQGASSAARSRRGRSRRSSSSSTSAASLRSVTSRSTRIRPTRWTRRHGS